MEFTSATVEENKKNLYTAFNNIPLNNNNNNNIEFNKDFNLNVKKNTENVIDFSANNNIINNEEKFQGNLIANQNNLFEGFIVGKKNEVKNLQENNIFDEIEKDQNLICDNKVNNKNISEDEEDFQEFVSKTEESDKFKANILKDNIFLEQKLPIKEEKFIEFDKISKEEKNLFLIKDNTKQESIEKKEFRNSEEEDFGEFDDGKKELKKKDDLITIEEIAGYSNLDEKKKIEILRGIFDEHIKLEEFKEEEMINPLKFIELKNEEESDKNVPSFVFDSKNIKDLYNNNNNCFVNNENLFETKKEMNNLFEEKKNENTKALFKTNNDLFEAKQDLLEEKNKDSIEGKSEEKNEDLFEEKNNDLFEEKNEDLFEEKNKDLFEEKNNDLFEEKNKDLFEEKNKDLFEEKNTIKNESNNNLEEKSKNDLFEEKSKDLFEEKSKNLIEEKNNEEKNNNLFEVKNKDLFEAKTTTFSSDFEKFNRLNFKKTEEETNIFKTFNNENFPQKNFNSGENLVFFYFILIFKKKN